MKINNIDFNIIKVEVSQNYNSINTFRQTHFATASDMSIKIIAQTQNNNLFALDKWFNQMPSLASQYKHDAVYNSIQIYGILPIDYTFNQYNIDVTFSADYISGSMELFNKQKLRKEKLKEIQKKYDSSK